MNHWSPDIYNKAWHFATLAHQGQTYGGAELNQQINYINHIGSVAMEITWALSQSTTSYQAELAIQCALLHDVIEDTTFTYADLQTRFGEAVANGVLALTKDASLPSKEEKMQDSLRRIQAQPYEVWMVKLADRISNLYHPPFYWNNDKILSYRDEALLIYEALYPANAPLAQRLMKKINEYPSFLR